MENSRRLISLRALLRQTAALAAAVLLTGCETLSYYAQAVGGQISLMARAQPLETVIADAATTADLRVRLELARSIRDYASRELMLPDNGSYRSYADLERPYVVWNVVAAPEFSLSPVESCFPVAGCVPYRGFFAREDAERYAQGLRIAGNDVELRGVPAYSTLGRFDDPLLSTFIRFPDVELARLIFHELAHQLLYVKGDATFNESFAVAVERSGVRRWLAATGRSSALQLFFDAQDQNRRFFEELERSRARLRSIYATQLPPEAMRERKRAELAALKQALSSNPRFRSLEPNNALLASYATYTQLVPAFEKLLEEEGGDLGKFYSRVKALSASEPSSRGPLSAPIP
ncbi:MAG: aminopeptidase [Candidatus Parcubacteria bacterium]|nr:aminopeptidase [Burkholderiales bacterium]